MRDSGVKLLRLREKDFSHHEDPGAAEPQPKKE
jgi:hypothetical protein